MNSGIGIRVYRISCILEFRYWDSGIQDILYTGIQVLDNGVPYGSRTRVFAVKGRCPGPLDEGNPEDSCCLYEAQCLLKHR